MLKRFQSKSKSSQAAWGLMALLLSCGLCSRLGTGGDKPKESPTEAVAEATATTADPTATNEPRPTDTEEATATEAATATEKPTVAPTAVPVQPTSEPAYMSLDPLQDRDCAEFPSQAAAQAYWDRHQSADRPNPGRLDGNGNGRVCEDPDRAARQAPAQEQAAPPPAAPAAGCISFNTAGYDDLRRIKHVDDKIANEILSKRPFSGWDDLVDEVNGIGKNNVKDIQAEGLGCF